jgi:diaminopimelate decarboxylase
MAFLGNGILSNEQGHLSMDGVDLTTIADKYGTPLYVFSEKRFKQNVHEILTAFRSRHANSSLHYAAKTESTLANLQIVREAGGDLEVNSGGELYKGLRAGFRPDQIVFNGVGKTIEELEYAITQEIKSINVDSISELFRISSIALSTGEKANITLRIVPEVSTGVVKGNETGTHESKFGIMLDELERVLVYALGQKELNVLGYHFHIGTQTYDLMSFVEAFRVMLKTAVAMYKYTKYKPIILNVGGGLPVPHHIEIAASQYMPPNIYAMYRGELTCDWIAEEVLKELKPEQVKAWAGEELKDFFTDCEFILEAGRKVSADTAVLLSRIENEKKRIKSDESWITLDAGFNTLLEVKSYYWYYHMVCANKLDESHVRNFKVAGPCCDSGDVFFDIDYHKNLPDYRKLPESTKIGDLIGMLNVGAYGTPTMSNYNGRPRAGAVLITEAGEDIIIRPAETYEDLVKHELDYTEYKKEVKQDEGK